MLDPKIVADLDQAHALIKEGLSESLWSMYCGCAERGFSPEQSLHLTTEFLKAVLRGTPPGSPLDEG